MIFESGKNGENLVTSCRNCTCWTRLTVFARTYLVILRPGGRREEGYVIATIQIPTRPIELKAKTGNVQSRKSRNETGGEGEWWKDAQTPIGWGGGRGGSGGRLGHLKAVHTHNTLFVAPAWHPHGLLSWPWLARLL